MKILFFNTKKYDEEYFSMANQTGQHELIFIEPRLSDSTVRLAEGYSAICVFVNDDLSRNVLTELSKYGVAVIALRCAGYNQVDLAAAREYGIKIVRVPAYSPEAVAEHTVGLILSLNRKIHRAYNRVREGNFSLDGLLGFNLSGRTAGIIGTGRIGAITAKILKSMGMVVLASDPFSNPDCEGQGVKYVTLDRLFAESDIISLHCPLTPETHHVIDKSAIKKMKQRVMIINTSRGAVIDTVAVVDALRSGKIGWLGLDVYEQEGDLFFEDLSNEIIQDDVFERLLTFPNVLVTSHQGFFTSDALVNIAETTLGNITEFEQGHTLTNVVDQFQ